MKWVLLSLAVLSYYFVTSQLGADDDWWNPFRRYLWPKLDEFLAEHIDNGYAAGSIGTESRVGRYDATVDQLEVALVNARYTRNPVSSLKSRTYYDDYEASSWAYRYPKFVPEIFCIRQVHVTLFENEDGTTTVYSHEEYNSINPFVLRQHYRAHNFNVKKGVRIASRHLSEAGIQLVR